MNLKKIIIFETGMMWGIVFMGIYLPVLFIVKLICVNVALLYTIIWGVDAWRGI